MHKPLKDHHRTAANDWYMAELRRWTRKLKGGDVDLIEFEKQMNKLLGVNAAQAPRLFVSLLSFYLCSTVLRVMNVLLWLYCWW